MLPGYNTDFTHGGQTYHVQTEDNGLGNPVVVTLLYHKGAILASRRTSYQDLVGTPGFAQRLAALMQSQHKALMSEFLAGAFGNSGAAPRAAADGKPSDGAAATGAGRP